MKLNSAGNTPGIPLRCVFKPIKGFKWRKKRIPKCGKKHNFFLKNKLFFMFEDVQLYVSYLVSQSAVSHRLSSTATITDNQSYIVRELTTVNTHGLGLC